ncbi:MAG: hypothetical protein EZS28_033129 [Streblomastix strix]|uniref:SPRY domain-containing protein n=1 Tax=Streblomastix strix TaxID=222440 RepID=A0A5J4UNH8_9EUKA|nr:MAG: hypothetical protein EZS28_033129 [Streblomastix strix]
MKKSPSTSSLTDLKESEPTFVKLRLLSVILKLAEKIENPADLQILIPILEEIKKTGEKELSKKAQSILGCLQQAGITNPSLNDPNEKDKKIRLLEETIRRQEQQILRLNGENGRLIKENQKDHEEKSRRNAESERKDEQNKQQDEQQALQITELEWQLAINQSKNGPFVQIERETIIGEMPISITVQPGSYTKKINEFTYTSTEKGFKTFPLSPDVSQGIYKCEMKFNKQGDNHVGIMKSGLDIPFGKFPGFSPYSKDNAIFYYSGYTQQNSVGLQGNQQMKDGDQISLEVNLLATPRTAHLFINSLQQPVFVSGLPKSVQFWFFLNNKEDSISVLSIRLLNTPTAEKLSNKKELKWE